MFSRNLYFSLILLSLTQSPGNKPFTIFFMYEITFPSLYVLKAHNKVSLKAPLFQAEQSQLSLPVFTEEWFLPSDHFCVSHP